MYQNEQTVRIQLEGYPSLDSFSIHTGENIVLENEKKIQAKKISIFPGSSVYLVDGIQKPFPENLVIYAAVPVAFSTIRTSQRFNGKIELFSKNGMLEIINSINLNDYLAAVLGAEMGDSFSKEALKAQAIAIRTYYIYQLLHKRSTIFFDIKNLQSSGMSFRGIDFATDKMKKAVQETEGYILYTRDNKIALPLFHSTSGGVILKDSVLSSLETGHISEPVLKHDKNEQGKILSSSSPYFHFSFFLDQSRLQNIVESTDNDQISKITLEYFKDTACVQNISFYSQHEKKKTMRGYDFISQIQKKGYYDFGSIQFQVEQTDNGFLFTGNGFGHLCGMSQFGADQLAINGMNFAQILQFYFPDFTLKQKLLF